MSTHKDLIEEVVEELEPLLKWPSNTEGNEAVRKLHQTLTTLVSKVEKRAYRLAHYAEHSTSCFLFNAEAGEDGIENCNCGLREALQPEVTNKKI